MQLFPDASETTGKGVEIIVDSSPGRVNSSMISQIRIRGFYFITGVPNRIHVTQATDRNYDLFKSVYRDNLVKLTEYRVSNNSDKKTIHPTDIPILIFCGGPQEIGLKNAFGYSFGFEKNIKIWADIGVNPFDRN